MTNLEKKQFLYYLLFHGYDHHDDDGGDDELDYMYDYALTFLILSKI